ALGAPHDYSDFGATWLFTRSFAGTHTFNGDGLSDIAWRHSSGTAVVWEMIGTQVIGSPSLGSVAPAWSLVGQRDFDGDGFYDWLWRDGSGNTAMWLLSASQPNGGITIKQNAPLGNVGTAWSVVGTADFNGDRKGDILWRDTAGNTVIWLMNGAQTAQSGN